MKKASTSGEFRHNSRPLGGGCRRMTLWKRIAGALGTGKRSLEELLRERIGGIIELIVEQELEEALGAANSARVGEQRPGYRHGHRARTLTIVV
jgi:hypothetical protein